MSLFPVKRINQISIVVHDLEAAMRQHCLALGTGPWIVYTFASPLVRDMTYRGRSQEYRVRLALTQVAELTFELVQPLTGENIFADYLDSKGEGLHHIGIFVPSIGDAVAEATGRGYSILQSGRGYGRAGDGGYAFLDTQRELGAILELIEVPRERVAPEMIYPAP